jgi:uncharacterized protein (TIGR03790 family)
MKQIFPGPEHSIARAVRQMRRAQFTIRALACWLAAAFVWPCFSIAAGPAKPASESYAAATLVVFNSYDKESKELAEFYAEKRGIPKDHLIGLICPKTEEITRDEYDHTIADPLRGVLTTRGWWKLRPPGDALGPVESNKIRFIALMRGMPLKIKQAAHYPGDKPVGPQAIASVNAAAVDTELAVLGLDSRTISGAVMNPYFRSYSAIADANFPELMLVCRLDAPTGEIVRRMITDSIATENEGLAGMAYVDARGITDSGYIEGDQWLFSLAESARRHGTPVVLDAGPELFPENYPMSHAALYFGWYTEQATGPFVRPDFHFQRGAIAVHLHSYSAITLHSSVANWVGPLLAAGAAASLGNVYEPYLHFTTELDILHDRLRSGFTFAESCYMAQRALSWMTTFVGDPLYRPYRSATEAEELPATGEWAEYRKGARLWYTQNRAAGEAALRASGKALHSGVVMEGLGLLELTANDRDASIVCFEEARQYYGKSEDAMRATIHEVFQLRAAHRDNEALALAGKMISMQPSTPGADLLRFMESQIRSSLAKAK